MKVANILACAAFVPRICNRAVSKVFLRWQRSFKVRCCTPLRRRACALFFALLFSVGTLRMCSKVYYFEETIPFQRDLKLKRSDIFIDGEADSYLDIKLKHVDCARLRKEIQSKRDNFLYTGVLTSQHTVHTLGLALANTWGKLTDRIDFYTGNMPDDQLKCENMSIIRLPTVQDDAYPPQQKSFAMLEHICRHHVDRYKWFLRADDDGYLKISNLIRLLTRLDENKTYIIGLDNPGGFVRSMLYMKNNRRQYCDGSAVIYSRTAFKELCPVLSSCARDVLTHHEDLEVGRCVFKHLGHQCATSTGELKMKELFYHRTQDYVSQFASPLQDKIYVHRALHLHKIVAPQTMYSMHTIYRKSQQAMESYCRTNK